MKQEKKAIPALTAEDYYLNEQGLMVFTEKYHLKRGYCCGNGCKHCPYPMPDKKENIFKTGYC